MPSEACCVARPKSFLTSALAIVLAGLGSAPAVAQVAKKPPKPGPPIIVYGQRQSAVTDIAPIASVNQDTISAIGATSMGELMRVIKPLAESASGEEPIFLLNGQRISGYQEISALPPEAIAKVEVLPEPAALKFGYPPTRRVLNFITKRDFRQIEARGSVASATRGGTSTETANLSLTQLHKDSRLTIALEARHTSPLFQSERRLVPDPDVFFDSIGNVTGVNFGEIDPALSQLAGRPVTVAPVPADPSTLDAYAASANQPRLFDVGPYRMLVPRNNAWKAEATYADRLGGTLSGSINLTAEQSRDERLTGPAAVTLTVPASNPFSPFANTVLLQRYLTETDPLHINQSTTTLHAGSTLRGVTAGWQWDMTGTFDQKLVSTTDEKGIDIAAADAAIAAGADPFVPLDSSLVNDRLTDRSHLLTRTMGAKMVAHNTPVTLPAGDVTVTGTVEAERASVNSVTTGADPFDLRLARTRTESGASIDVPIASRKNNFVGWVGDLSVNASANVRRISGFGTLTDWVLGIAWSPFQEVQLMLLDRHSGTAPAMDKLASPVVVTPNSAVFDYATGRTEIVTVTQGGNPDLKRESKHVRSIALSVKPFSSKDLHINASYEDSDTRNQTGDIFALTPEFQSFFPDRFVRDSAGHLIAETFQPTNFYREREQSLHMTISMSGAAGKKLEKPAEGKGDNRAHYYAGAGPIIRFSDRLQLTPDTPVLDILRGDTVKGWGMPRVTSYFYAGIGYLGNGLSIDGWYQSPARVRSDIAASDLYFSSIFKFNVGAYVSVHHFLPKQEWTRHLQLRLDVQNVTDAHQHVHDANGVLPNRFQPDFLDPTGRTVKLTLRKTF